jgi:PAS domain S-box-containing protein
MRARILIAEDDAILALRIQRTVEAMGYEVAGLSATGEDTVRLTGELRPDVVLMDVCLRGEMTGVLAAAAIRAGGHGTPIIYATAYSDERLIEEAARTAPYAYLTKPIRDRELHASIESALYRSRTDRALAHLHRVLRSVRDVNQLITKERDPQRLLDQACDILLRTSGYGQVWVLRPDAVHGRLATVAHAGAIAELLAWTARQCETAGETLFSTALRTARTVVTGEPLAGAVDGPAAGSVAIVPMRHAERTYGCLCVHAAPPLEFGDDEIDLLQELAGDLAFALRGLDEEASRKRAEQALEESHENWRRLVEYQPTGNVVHRDGRILYANDACLRIVGLDSRQDAVGRDVLGFVHADSRAFVAARLRELAEGAAPGTAEVRLARAGSGEPVDVEMTSHAVAYLGEPAIQTVFWDVTERRRTEEQLRRAQKLDSVGRLAAGIAHDFNNMLMGIMGHAQMLMDTLHASDVRVEHADAILAAAQRCSDLSRQLLAFSRRQRLELRVVDLRAMVRRVEGLFRGTLREDVRLLVDVPEAPCPVRADVGQLEQVLLNLAVNAQDAMPTGGTLRIEVVPPAAPRRPPDLDTPPGPWVELIVTDTGCGMDAATREHAFEPFFTTKEPGKGTGLGLAMVHGIVKQHGGAVDLASAVGIGSTFTISLPACLDAAEVNAGAPAAKGPGGTETLLVVEDTAAVLNVTVTLLRRQGYTVLSAESGGAALELLERHHGAIDLLLTDVVMPDMNGKELAASVGARFPAVKVLFMSGHDPTVVANHGVLDERAALLAKPFTRQELASRIRRLLDGA